MTRVTSVFPSATKRAALRHTDAISRSRLRSPASLVYPSITARSAASVISSWPPSSPFSSSCFGRMWRLQIASFSSLV